MKKLKIFSSFALLVIFFIFLFLIPAKHSLEDIKSVKIAGQNIKIDLALTPAAQEHGLSGHLPLKENEGMLFIFPAPGIYPFWMKDMNFPIDIIWFTPSEGGANENMKVIYIKKDARPQSYPESFGPAAPAKYVLEVVSGFSDKNNLQVGDRAEFTY